MADLVRTGPARALGLGLVAAALAACASAPEPVAPSALPLARSEPDTQPPFDPQTRPRILEASGRLQCVPFARQVSGIQIFGNANTWWEQAAGRYPRSNLPAPGAVLVIRGYREDDRGHVAVVTAVDSSRLIRVDHANWLNGGEVSVSVPVLDVSERNDWSEVRVWHVPSGVWGVRVYLAEGFIHPFALQAALD